MSDIDLKSRYDIGWFSAYDTLKGMVKLYGFSKVLEALMEIGNLTPDAADGTKADPIPGTIWVWDYARPLYWQEYLHWQKNALPFGWSIVRAPEEGAKPSRL